MTDEQRGEAGCIGGQNGAVIPGRALLARRTMTTRVLDVAEPGRVTTWHPLMTLQPYGSNLLGRFSVFVVASLVLEFIGSRVPAIYEALVRHYERCARTCVGGRDRPRAITVRGQTKFFRRVDAQH